MPNPNLINKVLVEIVQTDESATVYDPLKREPINMVRRQTSFKINAQMYFQAQEFLETANTKAPEPRNLAGSIIVADGYIIVRKSDMESAGKSLSVNDKIISYGNAGKETTCEYYLVGKKDAAQYADIGRHTLERWYFKDKN